LFHDCASELGIVKDDREVTADWFHELAFLSLRECHPSRSMRTPTTRPFACPLE